jgi:hypothetical protein
MIANFKPKPKKVNITIKYWLNTIKTHVRKCKFFAVYPSNLAVGAISGKCRGDS